MAKKYAIIILSGLCFTFSGLAGTKQEVRAEMIEVSRGRVEAKYADNPDDRKIQEVTLYVSLNDLVIEDGEGIDEVRIFDITGREVYRQSRVDSQRLHVPLEKLPQSPVLLLVRIIDSHGIVKSCKVRL